MEFGIRIYRFWFRRIVLQPLLNSGAGPCLHILQLHSACVQYTWRGAATRRAQSAFFWSLSCETSSQGREFRRQAQDGRFNSWMRARSSRSHAPAAGIGEANLESRNVAAIYGTGTLREFWVGVSAGGSPTR